MIFRGGCIIRPSSYRISKMRYDTEPVIAKPFSRSIFQEIVGDYQNSLSRSRGIAIQHGIPVPAFSSCSGLL